MSESDQITGRQIAAARTLAGINQDELAQRANISVPTLRRMEASDGAAAGLSNNVAAVRAALEAAGVEFTNGGQPGVRLNLQPIVSMVKDGTYEIRIPIPGRARPHLLPRSFQTEDLAHGWLQSSEGAALVDRVRGKYVKTSAGTISAEELNASNDDWGRVIFVAENGEGPGVRLKKEKPRWATSRLRTCERRNKILTEIRDELENIGEALDRLGDGAKKRQSQRERPPLSWGRIMLFARDGDPIKWKMESALESAGVEFTNGTARGEAEGGWAAGIGRAWFHEGRLSNLCTELAEKWTAQIGSISGCG